MRASSLAYKWVALSNTTLGMLLASLNQSILIIALPAVFRGIRLDPLSPRAAALLLWVLLGFSVATTLLLVSFGRLSDLYGRVRLYNLGFAVFALGSLLLTLTWGRGAAGAWQLILFRLLQGVGGAFLMANSAAILVDAFGPRERGLALGLNQLAAIGGTVAGLVLGGILAAWSWRAVFLVSAPVGVFGTLWSYRALRELSVPRERQGVDVWGNLTFGLGLLGILLGLTYGILPYGSSPMGWHSPLVVGFLAGGALLLAAALLVERRVSAPMFPLSLLGNRAFLAGNAAGFLAAVARGGLQFVLVLWLQGLWLPLHGVPYADTPLQAGLDTLPQMAGFVLAGPLSGYLSDRVGARWFGFAGMMVSAVGYALLGTLPPLFSYPAFAADIFLIGLGMGLFASPNASAIMNAVPPSQRGVASGIRATFQNAGMLVSMGLFFTLMISALAARLPASLGAHLRAVGLPEPLVHRIAHLPPTAALFAALLGYNPMAHLLPARILHTLSPAARASLLDPRFFPSLFAGPFLAALREVFLLSLLLSVGAAVCSLLRGGRTVYEEGEPAARRAPGREPAHAEGGMFPASCD